MVPLFFSMLLNLQDGKDEHIRSACLDALASISSSMKWSQYYALLIRCFRYIKLKPDRQNPLLRLVSSILDHFHFSEMPRAHELEIASCDTPDPYVSLHKNLFPKIQKLTVNLKKQLTQNVKSKLESILSNIAAGIECNASVDQTEFFVFTHGLIEDCLEDEDNEHGSNKLDKEDKGIQAYHSDRLVSIDRRLSHLIAAFALGLLQNYMKNLKLDKEHGELLSLLDPFVSLLWRCLSSKHGNVTTTAIKCLSPLVRLPLPSLQSHADKIKNSLLVIVQGSVNASSPLSESCIKLLTTLLRSTRVTFSAGQLHMLTQFPLFVDLAKNPTFAALSLLKAIVHRKLEVPVIYDIIQIVAELMVQSQQEHIRKKCGQIFLQFLLGYHISEKRLQQHLDFLLANLSYKHPNGREAVLEMLHAVIKKFPQKIVDEKSQIFFVHLVFSLANDKDSKVRSMTAAAMKCLIGHVSSHSLVSILEYSQSWYIGGKQNLWGAAAQVLGLLVEVMGEGFKENICCVLPVMRSILQSALSALTHGEHDMSDEPIAPFWKEAYYSLVLFEKILHQFHDLCVGSDLEDMWEVICQFLLHPHFWLRNISNRILSLYFAVIDAHTKNHKIPTETFFLMKPSRLFLVAASFFSQLMAPVDDDASCTIIMQNLVLSICRLHSILGKNTCMDVAKFWSSLENSAQDQFHKAFTVLDPLKGKRMLLSCTSDVYVQRDQNQHPFISFLLHKLGKISLQMEATQMKVVFNCFKSISPEVLGYSGGNDSLNVYDDSSSYAYQMLLPLYKVCEGYTGKVISDELKQLAHEVRESIRAIMGNHFIQVYNLVRKNLKGKRDKRKRDEKIMAVVNPERNAKRKLRMAAKHRNHKRRKIMSMKMGRWMR
ncbi:small subunit processome component 20 [Dorcoceras hygrometricum]|uniref:Small subunit processome component 20 n=1 Tax=Dorcoceras hygrometricum TaxID=472368 RepID=A0A2Z7B7A2_9LAMI|nr:small subunit processome component 20 [Dorcoceras hygrometricum]